MTFRVLPLDGRERSAFNSTSPTLNRYFHQQVGQDIRRGVTACFIAIPVGSEVIAGFYTLAAGEAEVGDLPTEMTRKLPRYPTVPVARLGRLAVDQWFAGQNLGAALLFDAVDRARRSELAVFALEVDAKDDNAAGFWRHHGFQSFASNPLKMIAPLASLLPH